MTMTSDYSATFSVLDYILFALTLSISASIGVFYAIRAYRNKENLDAFLTGSRSMPLLPTTLSLFVSFVSGITIISYPIETYTHGLIFLWTNIGASLAPIISGVLILPVLHRMKKSISIYAYLEFRFGSKLLRSYASLLYQINTLVYMAVVLYTPSISLSGVTGIDVRILIVSVGLICTIYTSIGGLKAVVWSDSFQAFIMYAGLLALAIRGTINAGGIGEVFDQANRNGRIETFLNISPSPFQYLNVWMGIFGGCFYWLTSFGSDQTALQRYYSLPTVKKAQIAAFLNVPALMFVTVLVVYIGLTMIPKYVHCDPRLTDHLEKDQMLIIYMLNTLGGIYGLPGLFLACVFSGTLSSISSGINSLSTVFLEDFVKPLIKRPLSDRNGKIITKSIGFFYGITAVCMAFAAGPLGGIFKSITSAYGALSGPLVGVFLLGILFPRSNWVGALIGTVIASALSLWVFIGSMVYNVNYPELPVYVDECQSDNFTTLMSNSTMINYSNGTHNVLYTPDLRGVEKIYALSYMMYPCISAFMTIFLGLLISWCTNCCTKNENSEFTYWTRHAIPDLIIETSGSNDEKEMPEKRIYD